MTGGTSVEIRPEPPEEDEAAILAALETGDAAAPELGAWATAALEEGVEA